MEYFSGFVEILWNLWGKTTAMIRIEKNAKSLDFGDWIQIFVADQVDFQSDSQ